MKNVFFAILSLIFFLLLFLVGIYLSNPKVESLKSCLVASMHGVQLCPGKANYVRLKEVSPVFVQTLLISEDASFYSHNGFDLDEIKQSFYTNLKKGRFSRGGSTITQQLVKNVFLNEEKSLVRKLREAMLTSQVEKIFSKNEILEKYVNVVEFGKNLYGIKAASNYYFNKLPKDLNVLEAAYLTYLLPSPVDYSQSFAKRKLTEYGASRIKTLCRKLVLFNKVLPSQCGLVSQWLDRFPWHDLTSDEIAGLKGESPVGDDVSNPLLIDKNNLTDEQLQQFNDEPELPLQNESLNPETDAEAPSPDDSAPSDDEVNESVEGAESSDDSSSSPSSSWPEQD